MSRLGGIMRVVEIYVERLKSYGDFSNRRIGLKAILDEGESLKDAYLELATECETLLEIREIEADLERVKQLKEEYEKRKEELEMLFDEYNKIRTELRNELRKLAEEISRIERLAEEGELKLKESILEKLRKIRIALGWYDDP